jgi:hypothetical protein
MNAPTPVIRLDRSRDFSEIHGDRETTDPHYLVHYVQNGLPFGANELLVPDDGRTESWKMSIEREDGTTKVITMHPLYTKEMRETVKRRTEKLASKQRVLKKPTAQSIAPQDPEDELDEADLMFGPDEVNVMSWLRGEVDYEPNELYAACKKRFSRVFTSKREIIEELVIDAEKPLVPQSQLAPEFRAMFEPAAA